jgi:PilZ domain
MIKTMRHNEVKGGQVQYLQTNCSQCVLKKEEICPYLEQIANCHLFSEQKGRNVFNGFTKEKRQYPRMITSIPAFVRNGGSGEAKSHIGSIIDMSLGGLRISIPRGRKYGRLTDPQTTEFEIVTVLPDKDEPIYLKCKSRRVAYFKDDIHVGTSIIDADIRSYEAFKNYLM